PLHTLQRIVCTLLYSTLLTMGEAKDIEAHRPGPITPANPKPSLWFQSINPKHADLIALLLCFVTGLCDSSAYNAWTCFLAMQTGPYFPPSLGKHIHTC